MTEDEARAWLAERYPPAVMQKLDVFAESLRAEAERQSLIARSTFDEIWSRHILDSAQLASLAEGERWLDVGSGGGLPGLVLAVLSPRPITLVEPRRRRAEFLRATADALELANVTVAAAKVQAVEGRFDVVTARALSSLEDTFTWTRHVVSRETVFLLPRGRSAVSELESARQTWHGSFHVEQSLSSPDSGIVIAQGVRAR